MGRVIAGERKGLKLFTLDGLKTRPSSDRCKEALFNKIQNVIYDCDFLDLYSGSGQIGIEALSRGAKRVIAIEKDREACKIINRNVTKAKYDDEFILLAKDVRQGLKVLASQNETFNIVFMDPPYVDAKRLSSRILKILLEEQMLKTDSLFIVECSSGDSEELCQNLQDEYSEIDEIKATKYGNSTVVYVRFKN